MDDGIAQLVFVQTKSFPMNGGNAGWAVLKGMSGRVRRFKDKFSAATLGPLLHCQQVDGPQHQGHLFPPQPKGTESHSATQALTSVLKGRLIERIDICLLGRYHTPLRFVHQFGEITPLLRIIAGLIDQAKCLLMRECLVMQADVLKLSDERVQHDAFFSFAQNQATEQPFYTSSTRTAIAWQFLIPGVLINMQNDIIFAFVEDVANWNPFLRGDSPRFSLQWLSRRISAC
mmetsp:Transcript_50921/g.85099  ORF Transcript_50921/g.85099 Transcript_50921/m.85099 type:complete len:231 (-) Transcript_50921:678-1370(-)